MAKASTISLEKLSSAVKDAVTAASQKHPNLKLDPGTKLSINYLIWGIPAPDQFNAETVRAAEAVAKEVAASLGHGLGGALGPQAEGAVFVHGGHVIIGIPAPRDILLER